MATMPIVVATPSAYAATDLARARLLRAYLAVGLLFMLVPGTFLGVMNLIQISTRESAALVSPAWIQAHGHAQVFGWIGTFMLGIGFYSVPSSALRRAGFAAAWIAWGCWTLGITLRWVANVQLWHWRVLWPVSALLELAAFVLFLRTVAGHRASEAVADRSRASRMWMAGPLVGTAGWIVALTMNAWIAFVVASSGTEPVVPHLFDQRFLTVLTWGVFAPFIWGFCARWLPVLLGLDPFRPRLVAGAVGISMAGVGLTLAGYIGIATWFFIAASILSIAALRLFEPPARAARTRGIDARFPLFVRLAYGWLLIAAAIGLAAAHWDTSGGLWGASRHAFTVGFTSAMVFLIGQRMLPGFAGHKVLWSSRLMLVGLVLLMVGCGLRVSAEVIAYQGYGVWAWSVLPASAVIELAAITAFAVNMFATLWW